MSNSTTSSVHSSDEPDSPGSLKDFIVSDNCIEYDKAFNEQQEYSDEEDEFEDTDSSLSDVAESVNCDQNEDNVFEVINKNNVDEDYEASSVTVDSPVSQPRRSSRKRKAPTRYIDVKNYKKYMLADDIDYLSSETEEEKEEVVNLSGNDVPDNAQNSTNQSK